MKTPALSGFPSLNLRKQTPFNPSDALLSTSFTKSPLSGPSSLGSGRWVPFGPPASGAGAAMVAISGTFIAGHFEGNPAGFEVRVTANTKDEIGGPAADGVELPCSATAVSFSLKRAGAERH